MAKVLVREGVAHRTRALPRERAFRFARMLEGNSKFEQVWVLPYSDGSYHVEFRPASPKKQAEELRMAEQQREDRASDMLFTPTGPSRASWWVRSPSGRTYTVSLERCTCPDFEHRAGPAGIRCKHMLSLQRFLENQDDR